MRVLVTGATGRTGRQVVSFLLAREADVIAVSRNPATSGLSSEVQVLKADFSAPWRIEGLSSDVDAIFISPRALGDVNPGFTAKKLLQAAKEKGAQHAVALSAATVQFGGGEKRFSDHFREIEQAVEASGMTYTILRLTDFDANAFIWAPQIRSGNVVQGAYGDAATSPIHDRDIAAVSSIALMHGVLRGTHLLSGPQSLSQREKVRLIGQSLSKEVLWSDAPVEQLRQAMIAQGIPAEIPDRMFGYLADHVLKPGPQSREVEKILGRPAISFATWADENVVAFGGEERPKLKR
jgi:uncharacterized protein YbjT (DUF2867 family)